jgi:hypothetical protein
VSVSFHFTSKSASRHSVKRPFRSTAKFKLRNSVSFEILTSGICLNLAERKVVEEASLILRTAYWACWGEIASDLKVIAPRMPEIPPRKHPLLQFVLLVD